MNRRIARIKTVQALYQIEMTDVDPHEAMQSVLEDGEVISSFFESLVYGTGKHLEEIDNLIESVLENWSLTRIARVDRAILRMAVYEMKYVSEIPISVSINEAIDLAKGFTGDEESGKFVNGVLSKLADHLEN
ncbi:transcription antitermination factor NusB [Salipaludibacillus sp. HK11]|uniref:transcription antitermination factor NusB n=1 Tax=Salipaludibacillus sp. HK11 TaxID=3394320 RepID=UPI0039FBC692